MIYIIGGKYKHQRIDVPKAIVTRPTSALVRAAVFNILQHHIEGMHVLDLCAGSGAIGMEALSRGAAHVSFVEKNKTVCRTIKKNTASLGCEELASVYCEDAQEALVKFAAKTTRFDLIYIDPPYHSSITAKGSSLLLGASLVQTIDAYKLLQPSGWLILESSKQKLEHASPTLTNLRLQDTRRYGDSYLFCYRLF